MFKHAILGTHLSYLVCLVNNSCVLGSHLSTGFNSEWGFKGQLDW